MQVDDFLQQVLGVAIWLILGSAAVLMVTVVLDAVLRRIV